MKKPRQRRLYWLVAPYWEFCPKIPVAWLSKSDSDGDGLTAEVIDQMLIDRAEAKANRDFSRADAIRDELNAAGIIIEDSASGATWRRG